MSQFTDASNIAKVFEMEMKAEGHAHLFEENGITLRKLWLPLWCMLERGTISVGPSAPHGEEPC